MLSKEASSTIFWVFVMTWPGIEPLSPRPLANILTIYIYIYIYIYMYIRVIQYIGCILIEELALRRTCFALLSQQKIWWQTSVQYLFHAPPNVKVRHRAFFFGGSGRRAVATRPLFKPRALCFINHDFEFLHSKSFWDLSKFCSKFLTMLNLHQYNA